ncbi:MAG: DUF4249 family protein [Bacteroidia bacterium]
MKLQHIFLVILALSLFASCEEKIDLELGDTQTRVVIEGNLITETDSSYVRLSLTQDYFNPIEPVYVSDGTVEISSNQGTVMFNYAGDGLYKGPAGYKPDTSVVYTLKVLVDGKEYTATSTLFPMFEVDTTLQFDYRPASGFIEEGYAVTYYSTDNRLDEVYTKFNFGQNDTLFDQSILFTNAGIRKFETVPFELPFFRVQSGDKVMMEFRSIDVPVATYLQALANLNNGAPGPFKTPPANPPTNISGGAVGYFMATDIVRVNKIVP